ncbi:unnamed protein product [Clonostachys rosea]|uniref:Uncharacterized protein n=1 Tax=Bionectria ochroleuca TaxID=29856 RepID=A0ABY6UY33_BIOOC|nr:unnamed protein product [Clonostachys rosea]
MQGFNMGRYVPPDLEGTKISGNSLHRRAAPGTTRPDGSQTVRFEMPFPIWCSSCPKDTIIGQGVRFNARKVPAGKYYSTPIWSFHLRHADCGGEIVIKTDPKNTAYVVVSGARKRDLGPEDLTGTRGEGHQPILTDQERERLRSNAFASLEKTIADREQLIQANERISDLFEVSSRQWDDPYAQNQRLRKAFRKGRHEREKDAAAGEDLKDRMSFGYDLLPATEEDAKRAALVDFEPEGGSKGIEGAKALAKPLFQATKKESKSSKSKTRGVLKAEKEASARKKGFVSEVMGNTRLAQDPFLNSTRTPDTKGPSRLPGVKRKRPLDSESEPRKGPETTPDKIAVPPPPAVAVGLVDYDSS